MCEAWAAFEHARGVQLEQLAPRLVRLCREAAMWAERNEKPHNVHGYLQESLTNGH